jgi:acetoin utilization deacetylase AcuC-like enzyme
VLFTSIHQWPFYPGTGARCDTGRGAGEGATLNLPMAAGSGEREWLAALDEAGLPPIRDFRPDLVLISAGYDAHRDDPIGGCVLSTESFATMTDRVRAVADDLGAPVGAVLEGGYDLDALGSSVVATMERLAA